jgi:hypothetical protein
MRKLSLRLAVVVALLCFHAIAAKALITGVTIDPPNPSSHDVIRLTVTGQGFICPQEVSATLLPPPDSGTPPPNQVINGIVEIISGCQLLPPPHGVPFARTVSIGPLPEGSYEVTAESGLFLARLTVQDSSQAPLDSLFLARQRFEVSVAWHTGSASGVGKPEALTDDSGYFWFFDPSNPELLVKVIDGTAVNGHFWVFLGGLSDVDYTVTVTDRGTDRVRTYTNPRGTVASRADTSAF